MFPEKLVYKNNQCRTKRMNEVIGMIFIKDNLLDGTNEALTNVMISQYQVRANQGARTHDLIKLRTKFQKSDFFKQNNELFKIRIMFKYK